MNGEYIINGTFKGNFSKATVIIRTDMEIKAFILTPQNRTFSTNIQGTISNHNQLIIDQFVNYSQKSSNFGIQRPTALLQEKTYKRKIAINKNLTYLLSIQKSN